MSDQAPQASIIAIVTTNKELISGGGVPVFITKENNFQEVSMNLSKIMDASTHEIDAEIMIIVKR